MVKALPCIVEGGQNDSKTSQKCPCVYIWVNSQNRQLTEFHIYSYLPLKSSNSRSVKGTFCMVEYMYMYVSMYMYDNILRV